MTLRRVDALLLAIVVPLWAVGLGFHLVQIADGEPTLWPPAMRLDQGPGADGHPVVGWVYPDWEAGRVLVPGDVLLRVGPDDLAGVTGPRLRALLFEHAQTELPVPLTVRRGDTVVQVGLDVRRRHPIGVAPIWSTLTSIAWVLTGVLILLRAPEAPAARPLFLWLTSAQLANSSFFPAPPWQTYVALLALPLGVMVSVPSSVQAMLLLVPETVPKTRLGRWWPWLLAPLSVVGYPSSVLNWPFPADVAWLWLGPLGLAAFTGSVLVAVTRSFVLANPVGRRRIKWVIYGCFLVSLPGLIQPALILLGRGGSIDPSLLTLPGMALPVCLLIAVGRYNLFDIDRLISVTASHTVLGILALAAVLAGFPRAAALASDGLGLEPATGQLVFALMLAAVIVPAHRALRPQIDRLFFSERYRLERGVAELLRELSDCTSPEALYTRTGERLDAIVCPESCVIYARTSDVFAPAFVRGRVVPTAFEATGPLIAALARRNALLVAEVWQRGHITTLTPFDRAALETLGVAVVLPARRGDELVAFVCLGAKRSGDIYTETDLTLLEAVARKVSDELVRYDLTDIVERGRVMEEALRRYVPAAVTSQLASGGVEPAEREVSVLFVDIRGYTSFAEARQAAEVFTTVNRYAETVSAIARDRGGAIVEFSGDGMMVVFGAPQPLAAKERAAVEAGREIIDAVAALAPDGAASAALSVGVGIATGPAFVGDVRSTERRIWTAIGNTVNLAARLQQLTRSMDAAMVIDTPTWRGARYVAADFVCHEQTPIRGRSEPADVWVLPTTAVIGRGSPA